MAVTRLVAIDVDGTLIDHDWTLPEQRGRALERLVATGVRVVLATGKTWPSIQPLWRRFGLEGPHITCNGAAIVDGDASLLACTPLPPAVVRTITDELTARQVPYALYLDDGSLVTTCRVPALDILVQLGEPDPTEGSPGGRRVLKVLSVLREDAEGRLRTLAADVARVQRTSHRFLEWNHPEVDKGVGLRLVAERLGIDLADTTAIGDAENDVPMLEAAGTGIVVVGASPAAILAADRCLTDDLTGALEELAVSEEGRR